MINTKASSCGSFLNLQIIVFAYNSLKLVAVFCVTPEIKNEVKHGLCYILLFKVIGSYLLI